MVVDAVVVVQVSGVGNGGSQRRTNSSTGELNCWFGRWEVLGFALVAGCLCVMVVVVLDLVVIVRLRRIV